MEKIVFVGLDVDDKAFHGSFIANGQEKSLDFSCKPNLGALVSRLEKIRNAYPEYQIKLCYEAGYLGYSLQRGLNKSGFDCTIIAPSLIPTTPGDKVKTDRLDAEKLALYFSNNLLTPVTVPTEEEESVRDIIRSRARLTGELRRIKLHITSLCRRLGLNYRESRTGAAEYWTGLHRNWLKAAVNEIKIPAHKFNLSLLLAHLDEIQSKIDLYADEIERISKEAKYLPKVQALICYRGIDFLTAMILICEIGDVRRFKKPTQLISYAGMDLKEYSSGGVQNQTSLTKMGNSRIRTAVIESTQRPWSTPQVGRSLKMRRKDIDLRYIEVADRCMKRLYKRSNHLLYREKMKNKVKVACARELLCFVWESLQMV